MRTLALLIALSLPALAGDWRSEMKNVALPMRDGKSLAADIYLPGKEGKYPCVLVQTPYNKALMGTVMTLANVPDRETGRGAASDLKVLMDRDNYAYVFVDWRGFYGSKAAMAGVRATGFKRGLDGYDCVEWIAAQPWSDGKVGTWGGSALGKQQLDTAAERPPHLVCCVPLIASMGSEYAAYYEGGVLLEGHVERLDQLGFGVGEAVKAAPLPWQPVWKFAEKRSFRPGEIQVPCLMVTGWWDNYPDLIVKTFEGIVAEGGPSARAGSKLLIGPWDHVSVGVAAQGDLTFEKAALESGRAAKAFLDFHLRGRTDNGWDKTPRVRYWVVNGDGWRSCESWTALPREVTRIPLSGQGATPQAEPGEKPTVTWTSDPVDPSPTLGGANLPPMPHGPTDQSALSKRKDGAWFRFGRRDQPTLIHGGVELTLVFEANAPDCDFTARLCVAAPGGPPILLSDAAARAKVRDGEKVHLLKPGVKTTMTLRFPSVAAAIPAGHELSVYIASTNWPRYARNTGTGADAWDAKAAQPVKVTLHAKDCELRIPFVKE